MKSPNRLPKKLLVFICSRQSCCKRFTKVVVCEDWNVLCKKLPAWFLNLCSRQSILREICKSGCLFRLTHFSNKLSAWYTLELESAFEYGTNSSSSKWCGDRGMMIMDSFSRPTVFPSLTLYIFHFAENMLFPAIWLAEMGFSGPPKSVYYPQFLFITLKICFQPITVHWTVYYPGNWFSANHR